MAFERRTSESQYKFIQDRVKCVENYFDVFCQSFGGLMRANAKLRNKGDELTKHLLDYSDKMDFNSSSKDALKSMARDLAFVQDYQDVKIRRLEALVVQPLMLYSTIIKQSKADIKAAHDAATEEQKFAKKVDRVRQNAPSDARQLSRVEIQLQKAHVDASRMSRALEEAIESFEKKKLHDLKAVLSSYITAEMAYHAKSLETLTRCYGHLDGMSEDEDLKEFGGALHPSSASERLAMMKSKASSGSRASLASSSSAASPRTGSADSRTAFAATNSPDVPHGDAAKVPPRPATSPSAALATSTPAKPSRPSMLGGDDNTDDSEETEGDSDDDGDDDDEDD